MYYVLVPSSAAPYGLQFSDTLWLGIFLITLFGFAIIGSPLWMMLIKRIGKKKAWLVYSFFNAVSKLLALAISQGDNLTTLVVVAINGLPLGGQFITSGLLADVIDYDEFLTGERREAQFTMFSRCVYSYINVWKGLAVVHIEA